jgi:hypothetical protein
MVRAFIFLLAAVFCYSGAYAFQYGDYAWGKPLREISDSLTNKHPVIVSSKEETVIQYSDILFGRPCEFFLYFTGKSEILYMVKIVWKTLSVAGQLREALINNHGQPVQPEEGVDRYAWVDEGNEDSIALDYSSEATELYYSSGDIYKTPKPDEQSKIDRF